MPTSKSGWESVYMPCVPRWPGLTSEHTSVSARTPWVSTWAFLKPNQQHVEVHIFWYHHRRNWGSDPTLWNCLWVNGGHTESHRSHKQGASCQTNNKVGFSLFASQRKSHSRQTFPYDPGLPEGTGSSRRVEEGGRRREGKRRGGGRRQHVERKEEKWEEGEQESWNWTSPGWWSTQKLANHFVPKHSDVALICAKDILGRNDMMRSKILYHSKGHDFFTSQSAIGMMTYIRCWGWESGLPDLLQHYMVGGLPNQLKYLLGDAYLIFANFGTPPLVKVCA